MKKPFNRIITVMFENQYRSYVAQDPFMQKLLKAGANMTNYFGAFHPSQTNYIASLAGEVCNVTNDTPPASPLPQQTLVDLLEAKNVSWKAYMEAYPGDPWNPAWKSAAYPASEQPIKQFPPEGANDLSRYYRKHNAFASFHTIQASEERWNKIVDDVAFWKDVASKSLPEYSWFTPDIWNDGHYLYNTHIDTNPRTQLVPQLSAWLEHVFLGNINTENIQGGAESGLTSYGLNLDVDLLLTKPKEAWAKSNVPEGTLIVVTFDEADFDAVGYDTSYDGPNQIYTVLLGDMIAPGTAIDTPYNHYNLMRTVEKNFDLGSLHKNDAGANWFRFLWDEKFAWKDIQNSGIKTGDGLALTPYGNAMQMVFSDANGVLYNSVWKAGAWTPPCELNLQTKGPIAMAALEDQITLVYTGQKNAIFAARFVNGEWSAGTSIGQNTSGSIALTSFNNIDKGSPELMLCWVGENGFMQSMTGDKNGFTNNVVPVNQITDGAMTLAQLGASLFLVYKERNTPKMRITSYNTAPYNAITAQAFNGDAAPENNTSIHQWAVADFEVGHFAQKMAALQVTYQHLGNLAMATSDGEMHLAHRGGYQDLPQGYTSVFGLTGIYSAENQLTNGYGTLDQAGWTLEEEMGEVNMGIKSAVAMCSFDGGLFLSWVDGTDATIQFRFGGYEPEQ